jgi:hypothetical protein
MAVSLRAMDSGLVSHGAVEENVMANDAEWVEDVRRWYLSGASAGPASATDSGDDAVALGYEAADPALQARHWPDAPIGGIGDVV